MKRTLPTLVALSCLSSICAHAAERGIERYPEKPIRFIVPFPPGALSSR